MSLHMYTHKWPVNGSSHKQTKKKKTHHSNIQRACSLHSDIVELALWGAKHYTVTVTL